MISQRSKQQMELFAVKKSTLSLSAFRAKIFRLLEKKQGLEGSRSGLFYEATRLIRELKPEIFIFENVKGLLSSKRGYDFTAVLREIANIGLYECQWQLLNSRWVLPQNRERIFFVGCLAISKRSKRNIFPIEHGKRKTYQKSIQIGSGANLAPLFKRAMPESKRRDLARRFAIRDLTPIEYERLQGFPDNYTAVCNTSNTQRYKMLGNAVTTDIAQLVFERIYC